MNDTLSFNTEEVRSKLSDDGRRFIDTLVSTMKGVVDLHAKDK